MTDRIQIYDVPVEVCAIVIWAANTQWIVGCPRCVRNVLSVLLFLSIPQANVLSWIPIPWILIQIISSSL